MFSCWQLDWTNHWNNVDQALMANFPQSFALVPLGRFLHGSKMGRERVSLTLLTADLKVQQILKGLVLGGF